MRAVYSVRPDFDMSPDEAAATWFALLLSGDASDEDRRAIDAWRGADPGNAEAWAKIATIWDYSAAEAEVPAIQAMREAALARPAQPAQRRPTWFPTAVAAGLAVVVAGAGLYAGGLLPGLNPGGQPVQMAREIRTGIGQRQQVELADGSTVTVNTASSVAIAYSAGARKVDLQQGEAFFRVAPDRERPFTVGASDVTVTAVGTAFSVRKAAEEVDVVLAEGRVRVARAGGHAVMLEPGSRLRVTATGFDLSRVDAIKATSWTSGRVSFDQTPLREAIAEFNRYSTRKIVLADPGLGAIPVTGEFATNRPDDLVSMLAAAGLVRGARRADGSLELHAQR